MLLQDLQVKGILFDLDATLLNSEHAYAEALENTLSARQVLLYSEARALVKKRLPCHTSARNRWLYFKVLLELEGFYCASKHIELCAAYERALMDSIGRYEFKLNRRGLLEQLSKKFKLGLVTNENLRTQVQKLQLIDPDGHFFSKVVCSEEWGVEKPSRILFHEVLKALGLEPSSVLFVGDDVEADIVPSLELGMHAALSCEFKPQPNVPAGALKIEKLDELRTLA